MYYFGLGACKYERKRVKTSMRKDIPLMTSAIQDQEWNQVT